MATSDRFITFISGPAMPPKLDRSDEVRSRRCGQQSAIEVKLTREAFPRLACVATHQLAIWIGTMRPLVACCSECTLYPQGHPTTWSFPA